MHGLFMFAEEGGGIPRGTGAAAAGALLQRRAGVLGSRNYVNAVFREFRERFGPRRQTVARPTNEPVTLSVAMPQCLTQQGRSVNMWD